MGEHLLNFWRLLLNAAQQAAIAENPAVMTAAGWRINRNGLVKLDLQNNKNVKQLRNNLTAIGDAAITAPTMAGDIDALATAVRHPVLTIEAVKKGIFNVFDYVRNINKIRKELNKGIKENSILESYNTIPANKDIGTAYDYLDFLDNIYPNSKLNATFYHGGPKEILKFKSAKLLGKTNKGINSGTKDYGIYLADDKSLALYYAETHKKANRHLYNVRVNVQNPMRYETNNWYMDKMSTTGDLRFRPGEITLKWYDRLNLKNYDGIYHTKSKNAFENGELVMFDGNNIHIMGTPEESLMFRNWKLNPLYSSKPLLKEIPLTPELYERSFLNYAKAAKPGLFFAGLAATPPALIWYNNYQKSKAANARKWKHKKGGSFKGYPSKAAYEVRLEEIAGFLLGGTIDGGNPFGNKLVVVKPKKQKPYWVSAKTSLLQPQDLIGKKGLYLIDYFRNKFSPHSGVVDLSDKNVVLVENNPHPSMILFNEFDEEGNNNTVRRALDFKETTDTLLGNSNIPLKNISTYYGIENGKFKAGPINTFNDSTVIVPNRAKNYGKIREIILPTEELEEEYLLNRRDYSLRRLEVKDSLASEYVNKYNLRYDVRNPIYQALFPLKTDKDYFNENIKHRKNLKLQYQLEVNENLGLIDLRKPVGRFVTETGDTIPILATEINATPKTAFADENGNAIFVSNLNRNIDEVNRYLKKNPMYNILVDNGRFSGWQRKNTDYDRYKGFSNLQYTVGVQKNGGKMKKYLLGGGFFKGLGNFINSDAGKALISTGTNLLKTNVENNLLEAEADAQKALNEYDWEETMRLIQALNLLEANLMYLQWVLAYLSGSTTDLPSLIVAQHLGWKKYSEALTSGLLNLKNKNALIDTLTLTLKSNNWGNTFNGILTEGLGLVGNYLGNKNTQPST